MPPADGPRVWSGALDGARGARTTDMDTRRQDGQAGRDCPERRCVVGVDIRRYAAPSEGPVGLLDARILKEILEIWSD